MLDTSVLGRPSDGPRVDEETDEEEMSVGATPDDVPGEEEITCAICLSACESSEVIALSNCSHSLCAPCMGRFISFHLMPIVRTASHLERVGLTNAGSLAALRACRCPTCATPFAEAEMLGALTRHHTHLVTRRTYRDALISAIATREATPAEAPAAEPPAAAQAPPLEPDPQAERAFRDWARRLHIKYCPSCAAPIEKNGGCHNMSCSNCGETALNAQPLAPGS